MCQYIHRSSHPCLLKYFGHLDSVIPVCLWLFGDILNALSNGKINKFLIYAFLLRVTHFPIKGQNINSFPENNELPSLKSWVLV